MSLQTGLLLLLPHYAQSSHTRYNCTTRLPAAQSWDAHLPRRGRPSAAGGARRRLVWRQRRRLAIVFSYTGSLTACLRCCRVESRRPPHCASCTVGSRSQSAMRRAYSSVSTAPREPGAVRARPRQRSLGAPPPVVDFCARASVLRLPPLRPSVSRFGRVLGRTAQPLAAAELAPFDPWQLLISRGSVESRVVERVWAPAGS